jgi:hypothetical protein
MMLSYKGKKKTRKQLEDEIHIEGKGGKVWKYIITPAGTPKCINCGKTYSWEHFYKHNCIEDKKEEKRKQQTIDKWVKTQ